MKFSHRHVCRIVLVFVLSTAVLESQTLVAQAQSVTASELRDAVRQSASNKQKNLDQVRSFFSDPRVSKVLTDAHIDSSRVQKAVSVMDAGDLAKLASRTARIQSDFAAGSLSNQDLTYIVIALGAAVLVLIVVAA